MRTLSVLLASVALTFLAAPVLADVTVYTNRSAWEAAAGGPFEGEDFNSIPGVYKEWNGSYWIFYYLPMFEGHNYVGDHPLDIERVQELWPADINASIFPGASSLVVDGTNFLRMGVLDVYGPFYIHLPEPVTAYGGGFRFTGGGAPLIVRINGIDNSVPGGTSPGFVGFVSDEPFSSLYFYTTDAWTGASFGHDNLNWVPAAAGGACCLADGSCVWGTEGDCVAQGGTFQGLSTTCDQGWCPPPPGDLIDHYELEGDGSDSAGGDANGTVGANLTFGPGVFGQAAVYGTSGAAADIIQVPRADAFSPGMSNFSIAFWVKRDNVDSGNPDGVMDCISGTTTGWALWFNPDDYFVFRIDDDSGYKVEFLSSATHTDTTAWHHYALTVDRVLGEARLYIDGNLDGPFDVRALASDIYPSQTLNIGTQNTQGLDGALDELRFYNYALSEAEVQDLASTAEPGDLNCDGLINGFDIDPFVLVLGLSDPYDEYYALYPDCDHMLADINDDGFVNGFDIDPFIDLVGGG